MLALAVAVPELRERSAAAEARRLAASIDLAPLVVRVRAAEQDGPGRVRLRLDVGVRNRGGDDVSVLGVQDPEVALATPTTLRAGGRGIVSLTRGIACSAARPPVPLAGSTLLLRVRTTAGQTTAPVKLLAPAGDTAALRACGFLPLEQTVDVSTASRSRSERTAELRLELVASPGRPLSVTDVGSAPWLQARLQKADGGREPLPVPLAVQGSDVPATTPLRLLLEVTDCAAGRAQLDAGQPARLWILVEDTRGRVATKAVDVGPLAGSLVDDTC